MLPALPPPSSKLEVAILLVSHTPRDDRWYSPLFIIDLRARSKERKRDATRRSPARAH